MSDFGLAGDKMKVTEGADGTTTILFDDVGTGRKCGECQLCCRLVPVPPIGKQAGHKCQHQRHRKGCTIYENRPFACRVWSCRWLADPDTAGMSRPDHAHYVIDMGWDYISMSYESGKSLNMPVVQVWIDPAFRNAYRAPELRAYMEKMALTHRAATIVRFSRSEAVVVFAPCLSDDGLWHEKGGKVDPRSEVERLEAHMLGEVG